MEKNLNISVVVPVYNEADSVDELYRRIKETLVDMKRSYEIIIVDDGSTDKTLDKLEELYQKNQDLAVISFRKNFGQSSALAAGFDHAKGDYIVTIDGDLQNDPKDIPMLIDKLKDYDLVNGWRYERKDPFLTRKLPSFFANGLISWVTGVRLHDYGCTLKAFRKDIAKNLHLYGEMHRFIPAIASWMGVSVGEVKVSHHPRKHGKSKYGLSRISKVVLDLINVKFLLAFATNPIRIFGFWGMLCGISGFAILIHLAYIKIFHNISIWGRPLLLLGILLMLIGLQLLAMGLLGEMLSRIYRETAGRPTYAVRKILQKSA